MDCSMREASRIEQSIAPKIAFSEAIGTHIGEYSLHKSFFSCFRNGLIFLQPEEWCFVCFLRPCISGTFGRFIPCNMSRLKKLLKTARTKIGLGLLGSKTERKDTTTRTSHIFLSFHPLNAFIG